jgi:pimeloyl-ACP methyl ester carboxylesterase
VNAAVKDNQFVELSNGTRLHYASAGERGKPLMLFVHGFPEFWYAWNAQLAVFGQDYFVVAPDLRGFNLSDMPTDVSAYKPRYIMDDLRLLAAHFGYEKFTLVAHDWGGAIAWNLAIALPQLLHKLIIINSPHPYLFAQALAHDPQQQQSSAYMNWLRAADSEIALARDDFALMDGFFQGEGQPMASWYTDDIRQKYHQCWTRGLTGGVNYYRASPLHPPTAENPGAAKLQMDPRDFFVTVPTRVIWGESDKALPATLLDGLDDMVGDLQVRRVAGATHWIIHEQSETINRLIREFLSE